MSRIPDDVIDRIRDRSDIVAIIGEHVQLSKKGLSFWGLCPFHREKSPSFQVRPDHHYFHCFGCDKKGDVFKFLMELEGKTFIEVLRELAPRAGVTLPEREETPEERHQRDERARLLEVNAIAASFYRDLLAGPRGAAGRAYLDSRGIGAEIAEKFRLGMAPDGWDALAQHLEARRVVPQLSVLAGLLSPRKQASGFYDQFRNRLMCPVILPAGEVVAFSGRRLSDNPEEPKYRNSPQTPVYTKGHVLFGLHAARTSFRARGRAVIVEGNFDVLALHQAGFPETVAPLGTALTARQVESLRLLAPSVVLCLDADEAGRAAALKHIVPLVEADVETRVALLPAGDDPDTFVRREGRDALEALLGRAQPAVEYFIHTVWGRSDRRSADRRAAALAEAAPVLARVPDEAKREMLVGELALALGIAPELVARTIRHEQARTPRSAGSWQQSSDRDRRAPGAASGPGAASSAPGHLPAGGATPSLPPPPAAEVVVLALLADHPGLLPVADGENVGSLLTDERLRDMYSAARSGRPLMDAVPQGLGDRVLRELLAGHYINLADPQRTLCDAIGVLRSERLLAEVQAIDDQIRVARAQGDDALVRTLLVRQIETRGKADALRRGPKEGAR